MAVTTGTRVLAGDGYELPPANLADYDSCRTSFSWAAERARLDGLPEGRGLNIAHEAVDRHVAHGAGDRIALRLLGKTGISRDVDYAELSTLSNRFANALDSLGVQAGEVVSILCGRQLELFVAAIGGLKHRCVVSPLFSAFGPEPIRSRLELGATRVLVTTPDLYVHKIAPLRPLLPRLTTVLVTGDAETCPGGAIALQPLLDGSGDHYEIGPTDPETHSLLHFTSGTTGTPKGVLHVHDAVVAHAVTGRLALDLHDGDVYWCTADPGWVTGTSYGIIAPLVCGTTLVVDEAEMDPARWYGTLAEQEVCVWYTSPTAVRRLMRAGDDVPNIHRPRPRLRLAASVGEPLPAEAVRWGETALGVPIHDNWWQTETGGIMVANYRGMPIRPGSMGRPLPGIDAAVIDCDDEGKPILTPDGEVHAISGTDTGMLALKAGWPSMFRAYLGSPERYAACFARSGDEPWYLTGDLVRRDGDGYFWFVSRADDVIKTSGHLVGPFEVETVLLQHPEVADAGVYGVPDDVAGAVVHAVVVLRGGVTDAEATRRSVLAHARSRLGAAIAPRRIDVVDDIPKTRSGKVMRRLLRARELGLPEGDTSTMETTGPETERRP